jgi:hypothetical protein
MPCCRRSCWNCCGSGGARASGAVSCCPRAGCFPAGTLSLPLSSPFRRASSIGLSMRQPKPLASRSVSPAHVATRLCKLDIVFTVPAEIADIAFHNKAAVYDLLFRVASETMVTIAADLHHLGAPTGITAVLRTWGSAMTHHRTST